MSLFVYVCAPTDHVCVRLHIYLHAGYITLHILYIQ